MVAMALIIFIMAILSEAFVVGMKTFRDLKAVGDMDQNLRTSTVKIRDDLSSDHFEGRLRLSDPNFWTQVPYQPPREGFFTIVQMTPPPAATLTAPIPGPGYFDEGPDADGIHSFVATDHRLHFTVKKRGNQKDRFFSTSVPAASPLLQFINNDPTTVNPNFSNTSFDQELSSSDARLQQKGDGVHANYASQWAEVGYFLVRTTDGTEGPGPIGTPLFALYRCEFAITPDNSVINNATGTGPGPTPVPSTQLTTTNPPEYAGMSCQPGPTNLVFNNPSDLSTTPNRRVFNAAFNSAFVPSLVPSPGTGSEPPYTTTSPFAGASRPFLYSATLLMTDVISFHVQILSPQGGNKYIDVPGPGQLFDTSIGPQPTPYAISAIKISIRVWDAKTQQARQITVVQDM
jgi:hypothetical protein